MLHMSIDIETFSDIDIARGGAFKYAQSPNFQILLVAYSVDDGPVQVLDMFEPEDKEFFDTTVREWLFRSDIIKHAYNAAFEWISLSRYFGLTDAQAEAWLPQWRCTMLHAMYLGLPRSLKDAGLALGLAEDKRKLSTGEALIRYFCVPCKPSRSNGGRTRNLPHHAPDKWYLFKKYNARDVETEMAVEKKLARFPVPDEIQRQWELDQRINLRGVAVDMELVSGARWCGDVIRQQLIEEAIQLTGLSNPNSVSQLTKWLEDELDTELEDLSKGTVSKLLAKDLSSDAAKRVLEIRQELSKASVKKYDAIEACVCADGRVRGLLQFYGAKRTGREAGRLVQVQNLPRHTLEALDIARELVRKRNIAGLCFCYGSVPQALSALIRTAFVAAPGHVFIDADFSAIEARVIAWLAGEDWVLDVFRTHGKIYEATAAQMFGVPLERIKKGNPEYEYRQKGKVATLALGYQGGSGALIQMGALDLGLSEDELPDIVNRWRRANPKIVQFWYDIERAAIQAITTGEATRAGAVVIAREWDQENGLDFMTIQLPSGRKLYYPRPHLAKNRFGRDSLAYYNQSGASWKPEETYGGKLAENITQAVARDCLFHALMALDAAGFRIVFDVHDEVVIEAPAEAADLNAVTEIMSRPIPWAPGLPLKAEGWVGTYYRKD